MKRVEQDIYQHFARKQRQMLSDMADTCHRVDITAQEVVEMAISILSQELVCAASIMQLSERDFLTLCRTAFRFIKEQESRVSKDDAS